MKVCAKSAIQRRRMEMHKCMVSGCGKKAEYQGKVFSDKAPDLFVYVLVCAECTFHPQVFSTRKLPVLEEG